MDDFREDLKPGQIIVGRTYTRVLDDGTLTSAENRLNNLIAGYAQQGWRVRLVQWQWVIDDHEISFTLQVEGEA